MNRRKSRELAMELLYQMSVNKDDYNQVISNISEYVESDINIDEGIDINDIDMKYITRVLKGVFENRETIDAKIEKYLVNWKLERLSKIDLAIIRVAVYEIMFEGDIPNNVSVNEALELAKKYSEQKSVSFINGVIDKIIKNVY